MLFATLLQERYTCMVGSSIESSLRGQKFLNALRTLVFAALMLLLFYLLGRELVGGLGTVAILIGAILVAVQVFRTPARLSGVIALGASNAPELHAMACSLASRAGLSKVPSLYLVPSSLMNAFTFGGKDDARIFVTQGLLYRLEAREVTGVVAHEISHIRHNDLLLFRFAELLRQTTMLMSRLGWLLLFFAVPIYLLTGGSFPLALFAVLLGAPIITVILQQALFRTREFSADLGAAELTGDPRGLASALQKIDPPHSGLVSMLFPLPQSEPSQLFRSHPATEERIRRLLRLTR